MFNRKNLLFLLIFFVVVSLIDGVAKALFWIPFCIVFAGLGKLVNMLIDAFDRVKKRKEEERFREKYGESVSITPAQIEKKLQVLCECGFKIVSPYSFEDVLRVYERIDEFELEGHKKTLDRDVLWSTICLLGEDYKDDYEYGRCYCENLWFTDFETYEGYETYLYAVERMVKITQGALKLDDLKTWYEPAESEEDDENGKVWISFGFRGEKYEFSYEFKKWFDDVGLFTPIIKLLEIADSKKTFACYDFNMMHAIICVDKADLEKLNRRGVSFEPLRKKNESSLGL